MTLDALLAPYGEKVFLEEVMGESALHVGGSPGRFREVLSWSVLNHLLAFGGLGFPRLRLISGGQEVPPKVYLRTGINGYPRPIVQEVNSALRDGAVVAIESVEELHEPISLLCRAFEQALDIPVSADLNASVTGGAYSGLRRNESDLIVLQIDGSKAWRVYSPAHSLQPEPTASPAWEGVLSAGDLLYVPKGWWYHDQPLEPTLDLGIIFRNPTGLDVLQRLTNQMIRSDEMRRDCPRFGDPDRQSAFLQFFQTEVPKACARPGLLLNCLREIREGAEPRIHFSLPFSASALPPSEDLLVLPLLRFPRPDSPSHVLDEDAVELFLNGKPVRFREDAATVLQVLCAGSPVSVQTLLRACPDDIPRTRMLQSLSELVKHGVVTLEGPSRSE